MGMPERFCFVSAIVILPEKINNIIEKELSPIYNDYNNFYDLKFSNDSFTKELENAAKELDATDRIYVKGLSAKEYALGKNSYFIRNLIEQALQNFQVKGVIVYCSCLEVLTNLYENDVLDNIDKQKIF